MTIQGIIYTKQLRRGRYLRKVNCVSVTGLFLKSCETFRTHLGVLQFLLYLRNAKVLSHQTSQSSWLFSFFSQRV